MKKKRLKQIKKLQKKRKITLDELFADYTGDCKPVELNWGSLVGKEIV